MPFEIFNPANEIMQRAQESLRPLIENQKRLQQAFQGAAVETQRIINSIQVPNKVLEFFRELPDRLRNALIVLSMHGWFIDMDVPVYFLWEIEADFLDGDLEQADKRLMEYYRDRLPEIEANLKKSFPDRSEILSAAFNAHYRGEYILSIPVLLTQADGICFAVTKYQLFRKKYGVPQITQYIDKEPDRNRIATVFKHPLTRILPINKSGKERSDDFNELNRHQVLHGESVNYGTEINSLKAISLLNYVAVVLKEKKR